MHVSDPSHPPPSAVAATASDASWTQASEAPTAVAGPAPAAPPAPAPERPAASERAYEHCDECGAPVDDDQRYCVVCGAHRRHVHDPAARYLGLATARARTAQASGGAAPARSTPARGRSLGAALALALIPVAAAVGVAVGRSSNSDDAQLIGALAHRQAATVTAAPSVSPGSATSASVAHSSARTAAKSSRHHRSSTATRHRAARATRTTQYGTVTQITGSKATTAQKQQGAQDTQKVQRSTGKAYVNQQNNLPGTVVVP